MRFAAATVVLLAAFALEPPLAAAAPRAWPGRVVGYHDLTGAHGYHRAVALAVAAWNRLRLPVRFAAAPRGAASVQIVYRAGRCLAGLAGQAPLGFQRSGARVVVRSCPPVVRPLLVAHELGRVLGLADDDSGCTLMNSRGASDGITFAVPARCPRRVRRAWLARLVDPRSARRALQIYTAPVAPADVALTDEAVPRIEWRQPAGAHAERTVVARMLGRCPTVQALASQAAAVVYDKRGFAGLHWALDAAVPQVHGTYCYRVFNLNRFGRATASTPVSYLLDVPPVAAFSVATAAPTAGAPVAFADGSSDPDGTIVHWRWDFGDPGSGAADVLDTTDPAAGRAPAHTYGAPGSYVVTLTVWDDGGRSASTTAAIAVAAAGSAP